MSTNDLAQKYNLFLKKQYLPDTCFLRGEAASRGRVFRVDEIFLAKIFHFYSHSVPNGTGDGGGGSLFLPTFRP
jgi:hypothetical protein